MTTTGFSGLKWFLSLALDYLTGTVLWQVVKDFVDSIEVTANYD